MGMKTITISHRFTHLTSGLFKTRTTPFITVIIICKPSPNKQVLKVLTPSKSSDPRFRENFLMLLQVGKHRIEIPYYFPHIVSSMHN